MCNYATVIVPSDAARAGVVSEAPDFELIR